MIEPEDFNKTSEKITVVGGATLDSEGSQKHTPGGASAW